MVRWHHTCLTARDHAKESCNRSKLTVCTATRVCPAPGVAVVPFSTCNFYQSPSCVPSDSTIEQGLSAMSSDLLRKQVHNVAATIVLLSLLFSCLAVWAQEEADDNRLSNGHLGLPISVPLNPVGQFSRAGIGVTYGAGYNFTRRHAVIGEFMLDWLHPSVSGLPGVGAADGHSNLYTLTGNYRYELRGKTLGTYFIAGGGWYFRHSSLTTSTVTGSSVTCTREWLWWGATCSSGVVTNEQTLRSSSSSAFGLNGGIGFTVRVGDAPWRMYVESRYHYAPTRYVNTQLVITTIGIRY